MENNIVSKRILLYSPDHAEVFFFRGKACQCEHFYEIRSSFRNDNRHKVRMDLLVFIRSEFGRVVISESKTSFVVCERRSCLSFTRDFPAMFGCWFTNQRLKLAVLLTIKNEKQINNLRL